MNKLISIIVPVYNAERYLDRCINSLINQTYKNIEIILINDGSSDRSGEICNEYSAKDERIIAIHKKNEGVSSARNVGLEYAKGEYIAFCDADDWIEEDMYEILANLIDSSNSQLVFCHFSTDETIKTETNYDNTIISKEYAIELILSDEKIAGYLWNKLFSRTLIYGNEKLLFEKDIHILEDQLFVIRCMNRCNNVVVTTKQLYHYEQNEGSALNSKMSEKSISAVRAREYIYLELKHKCESKEVLYLAWSQMMKSCGVIAKKILFNNIVIEKKIYITQIKQIIKRYKNDFNIGRDFSIKDKLYHYMIFWY